MGGLLRRHGWIIAALALATLVRVAVFIAFPPGFVFSDGPAYLGLVDDLTPLDERTVGYGLLLKALAAASRSVWLVVAVQHLLGVLAGLLVYALLRRWGVRPWLATLAAVPTLFDAMELVLEHSVLSDVLFDLLVLLGVALLAWRRRPAPAYALAAGLVLGLAVCVRVVGEPVILAAALFCLLVGAGWRQRLVAVVAVVGGFLAPLVGYAAWYHHDHGVYALTESSGRALYMRTTTFVDCSRFSVPDYERPLCPEEALGQRQDPTWYGWHDPNGDHGLTPPAGTTPDEAMHDFAMRAIRAQPWDYLRTVGRDVAYGFDWSREDRYEYDTAEKWTFDRYLVLQPTSFTGPAYEAHGGEEPSVRQPWADDVVGYGRFAHTPGPILLALLVVALGGLVVPRRSQATETRPLIALTMVVGLGLAVAPSVTAEFVWRYQMPLVLLLPMSAALALTRLAGQPGTTAAPSTDWPNGGVNRLSRNRVVGTSNRS